MKEYILAALILFVSNFSYAVDGPGSGCGLTVTQIGTDADGDFRFSSNGSNEFSYLSKKDETTRMAILAYLTKKKVCIDVDKYLSSVWDVHSVRFQDDD